MKSAYEKQHITNNTSTPVKKKPS